MYDLWGFLLQTLTVSGVAVLLLILRMLFQDKLPPRWHWSLWVILGIVMITPAGLNGRYLLINWRVYVELLKNLAGDYRFTQVQHPVPVVKQMPESLTDWLFVIYVAGIWLHGAFYLVSYIKLRWKLRQGSAVCETSLADQVRRVAEAQGWKVPRIQETEGIASAFVCGVFRPVIVLPKGQMVDDKVILHEMIHLRNKDALWTIMICILRCLHWCNPLLMYCAKLAANDMEAACDQSVLERISGEERRDYGRILLSMVQEQYSRTPGSTCFHNGARNITRRIEAIARFKKYPKGMRLVSVCTLILLAFSMGTGVTASEIKLKSPQGNGYWAYDMALARSIPCTTPDAAFDAYGKSVLAQNGYYRMMCAPQSMQAELAAELRHSRMEMVFPEWESGLPCWPGTERYYVYNLKYKDGIYEGLMVVMLNYPPGGEPGKEGYMYLGVQDLEVYKEDGRWVAVPLDAWKVVEALEQDLQWGCLELPAAEYSGTAENIQTEVSLQTIYWTESEMQNQTTYWGESGYMYDTTPKGDITFSMGVRMQHIDCTHLGTQEERDAIYQIGLSIAPVYEGEKRPEELKEANTYSASGSNTQGEDWSGQSLEKGWGPTVQMGGGGTTIDPDETEIPVYYAADLYINQTFMASMDLRLREVDS